MFVDDPEMGEVRIAVQPKGPSAFGPHWRNLENLAPLPEGAGVSDYLDQVEGMLTDVTGDLGRIQELDAEKDKLQDLAVTEKVQSRFVRKSISRMESSSRQDYHDSFSTIYAENALKVLGVGRTHLEQARRLIRELDESESDPLRTRLDKLSQQLDNLVQERSLYRS